LNIEDLEPGNYKIRVVYVENPAKEEVVRFVIDNTIEYTENIEALNPFKTGDEIKGGYSEYTHLNEGTIIKFDFSPTEDIDSEDISKKMADSLIDASVNIYDCVGNLIGYCSSIHDNKKQVDVNMAIRDGSPMLLVFWSGRNREGRYVGSGGYVVLVSGKDINGEKIFYRTIIGVE